jgi:hypothetical protein
LIKDNFIGRIDVKAETKYWLIVYKEVIWSKQKLEKEIKPLFNDGAFCGV